MNSQVNLNFMLDYINNFTADQIFLTRDELIEWVQGIIFYLGFVVAIIWYDEANGQLRRKTFVLGCERGGKERKYKYDVHPSISSTRKCKCPFKLRGKLICNERSGYWR